MILRNLLVYYLLIVLPLAAIIMIAREHVLTASEFTGSLFLYILIYHPLISGLRLLASGKIRSSEFLYNFIPLWNLQYFLFLFFNYKGSRL